MALPFAGFGFRSLGALGLDGEPMRLLVAGCLDLDPGCEGEAFLSFESRLVRLDFGHFRAGIHVGHVFARFQSVCSRNGTKAHVPLSEKSPDSTRLVELAKVQIRRNRLNQYPASGSLGQIRPHQPCARHSPPIGHLPSIPNADIMYEALDEALRRQVILWWLSITHFTPPTRTEWEEPKSDAK